MLFVCLSAEPIWPAQCYCEFVRLGSAVHTPERLESQLREQRVAAVVVRMLSGNAPRPDASWRLDIAALPPLGGPFGQRPFYLTELSFIPNKFYVPANREVKIEQWQGARLPLRRSDPHLRGSDPPPWCSLGILECPARARVKLPQRFWCNICQKLSRKSPKGLR